MNAEPINAPAEKNIEEIWNGNRIIVQIIAIGIGRNISPVEIVLIVKRLITASIIPKQDTIAKTSKAIFQFQWIQEISPAKNPIIKNKKMNNIERHIAASTCLPVLKFLFKYR